MRFLNGKVNGKRFYLAKVLYKSYNNKIFSTVCCAYACRKSSVFSIQQFNGSLLNKKKIIINRSKYVKIRKKFEIPRSAKLVHINEPFFGDV